MSSPISHRSVVDINDKATPNQLVCAHQAVIQYLELAMAPSWKWWTKIANSRSYATFKHPLMMYWKLHHSLQPAMVHDKSTQCQLQNITHGVPKWATRSCLLQHPSRCFLWHQKHLPTSRLSFGYPCFRSTRSSFHTVWIGSRWSITNTGSHFPATWCLLCPTGCVAVC